MSDEAKGCEISCVMHLTLGNRKLTKTECKKLMNKFCDFLGESLSNMDFSLEEEMEEAGIAPEEDAVEWCLSFDDDVNKKRLY